MEWILGALVLFLILKQPSQVLAGPGSSGSGAAPGNPVNDILAALGISSSPGVVIASENPVTGAQSGPRGTYLYPEYTVPAPKQGIGDVIAGALGGAIQGVVGAGAITQGKNDNAVIVAAATGAATGAVGADAGLSSVVPIGIEASILKTPADVQHLNEGGAILGFSGPGIPVPTAPDQFVQSGTPPPEFEYDGQVFEPSGGVPSPCWLLGMGYRPNPPGTPGGKCVPPPPGASLPFVNGLPAHVYALRFYQLSEDPNPQCLGGC